MKTEGNIQDALLHLRYKPKRKNFEGCGECPAFDHFDWVIWAPDARRFLRFKRLFPKRVLCLAHQDSLDALNKMRFFLRNVTLVVAGEDTQLSKLRSRIDVLAPKCNRIYYEAKDVIHPRVKSFSMGFISFYLKRLGDNNLLQRIEAARSSEYEKEGVLAAWGTIWKYLDDTLEERREAAKFVEKSDWLHRVELEPDQYISRLAGSKYLLAPVGQGVQAPKLAESWLFRTVPIVIRNPCFEDLKEAGYPFLIIDKWSDLTPSLLDSYESTRQNIDWDKVKEMLTLRYFVEHVLRKV